MQGSLKNQGGEIMLAIGTRFWDNRERSSPNKILDFVERTSKYADLILVAINVAQDKSGAIEALKDFQGLRTLRVIPVQPWGFSSAMNTLIRFADQEHQKYLLSQSVEIFMDNKVLEELMKEMDQNTLCVGARLPDHEFFPGEKVEGNGNTVPWNTCCIWNLKKEITYLGFPLVAEGSFDDSYAGVEEVAGIGIIQQLYGEGRDAKLKEVRGINWKTEFSDDPARRLAHDQKIRRKDIRPRVQIGLININPPKILHIKT